MALSIIQLQHLMKCKWWITNFIHTPHGGRIIHQVAICMIIYLVIMVENQDSLTIAIGMCQSFVE